jgi:hypothetical protein
MHRWEAAPHKLIVERDIPAAGSPEREHCA